MPKDLGDSNALLERLLRQIILEREPDKCDQLGAEIWRVLNESDRRFGSKSLTHREQSPRMPVVTRKLRGKNPPET